MRKIICAIALAASVVGMNVAAGVASPTSSDVLLVPSDDSAMAVQYGGGRCERLRRACEYKDERGEGGMGNCRRYREECGGRGSYCDRLRRACENKDERGERGEGNCRRYREECR
jgi:hypothetical protein